MAAYRPCRWAGEIPELHPAGGETLRVVAGEALRVVEGLGPQASPRIIQVPVVLGSLERDFSREHCPVGFLAHLLAGYRHIQGSLGSSVEPEVLFRH